MQELIRLHLRVILAYLCDKDSPADTAKVAHDVRVKATRLRPKLDTAQGSLECLQVLFNEFEGHLSDTTTIQTSNRVLVTFTQNIVVKQILHVLADLFVLDSGEKHVDIDSAELHLDDRHGGLSDFGQLSHLWCVFEHRSQYAKEVTLSIDVSWRDNECIDITSRAIHALFEGTESKDFAA